MPSLEDAPTRAPGLCRAPDPAAAAAAQAAGKKPPWVVSTEAEHRHPHYRDLQMTRSVGDWLAV